MSSVRSTRVLANGIDHRVLTWGSEPREGAYPDTVLCHGFLDMAWSWHYLAEHMQRPCMAFDWRGHGESARVGEGGYYHFPDYIQDLNALLKVTHGDRPVHLVGHSMGGVACAMFAGTFSDRTTSLTLVEGLGPPFAQCEDSVDRMRAFCEGVSRARGTAQRPMATMEEAIKRLRLQHGGLGVEQARFLAERATERCEGGWQWRFDPLHRTRSPMPFLKDVFLEHLRAVRCPVLYVAGEEGFRPMDEGIRLGAIDRVQQVEIRGAGHMIHWFHAPELAHHWGAFMHELGHGRDV